MGDGHVTEEMLEKFYRLNLKKKEIDSAMNELKKQFHNYFDETIGENLKGQVTVGDYKLQRQIRTIEKFNEDKTAEKLEALNLEDLLVKKPDIEKMKAAISLGLLKEADLVDCRVVSVSPAISVTIK
ncbi:hypothetical protein PU629_10385 [Pullulanibacillus sp. KACC 23026]|uniref:hypothetical protein n=1 Tax=Pullulanibacillus sp. KACC 23026 TaxID=3028315 RepID=UPI0023B1E1A6|nr:hypothetical protein [Pullulanibacillus sp. KACC 23026]WEG14721.1 hypothetical protein PU629_10385 [Pullulanibacillus sp. KACC 23026]